MFQTTGISKKASVIAAAAVIGLTGIGLFAPAAHAAPNTTEGTKHCYIETPGGLDIGYAPGSTIEVTSPSGTKTKYKCDGTTGKWVEVPLISRGTVSRTFDSRYVTLLASSPLTTSISTAPTLGTLSR